MSHELRTPLNCILILGQQLGENTDGNLTPSRSSSPGTFTRAGSDLLNLINDILDLSKIESGTVTVEAEEISFTVAARERGAQLPARGRSEESAVPGGIRSAACRAPSRPTRNGCSKF